MLIVGIKARNFRKRLMLDLYNYEAFVEKEETS